jgi:hypothetical protein
MSSGNALLRFLGVGNLLDREYRNSPAYQWSRELARNGIEADATTIRFGVEWEGVSASGTYRLQYADDGHGMVKDLLREYMVTLGKGSKDVGGPHDNYALGGRMTLLPWNPNGVVVISMVGGETWMVKLLFDPDAADGEGEYVLEEVGWEDEFGDEQLSTVYPPYYDADLGFDWADTIPDFIKEKGHGTTFVLLGRSNTDNTVEGDPERGERHRYLGRKYFNQRFWELPSGVTLQVIEMPDNPADWPKSRDERNKYQNRTVRGAKSLIEYKNTAGAEFVAWKGIVDLSDGTRVHCWLRTEPKVETGGLGASSGFIGVLYRGELYGSANADQDDGDTRIGAIVYRQFGITSDVMRRRIFLIMEPPEFNETTGEAGVAPSTGRADLYWMGAGLSARSVKPADWSEEFGENMPKEILDALNAEYASHEHSDDRDERFKKVMDRFSKRWRASRARVQDRDTDTTTAPTAPGTTPRAPIDSPPPRPRKPRRRKVVVVRGRAGNTIIGQPATGDTPAKTTKVALGVPNCRWVTADDINEAGMLAAWESPNTMEPNGCILLDKGHPVIRSQVEYWQTQYPKSVAPQVEEIVLGAYEEVAVAKVAHMHALTGAVISEDQRNEMLVNPALTTGLLGLISEDALIGPRTGKLGTKRRHVDDDSEKSSDTTVQPIPVA